MTAQPAVAGIVQYLRDRRLQPGDRLPSERDFADRLGVGRNAVREALATLVTLRVVDSRPNSGIYLRHQTRDSSFEAMVMLAGLGQAPTAGDVQETTEVRSHLEVLAVGLACERRDDGDLQRLDAIQQQTERALTAGQNIAAHDTEFHLLLVAATHNSVLVRVLNAFYEFTASRRAVWFGNRDQARASVDEHRALIGHVRAKDARRARLLVIDHMDRASHHWEQLLTETI